MSTIGYPGLESAGPRASSCMQRYRPQSISWVSQYRIDLGPGCVHEYIKCLLQEPAMQHFKDNGRWIGHFEIAGV